MKIAVVVITYNDDYKLKEWRHWHEEYEDDIALHIIVDNSSKPEYLKQVEELFPDSVILKRDSNGGCTSAYNDGIRYALSRPDITHIALVGNDIRIEKGALIKCVELLDSDEQLGMVAPVLLEADSDIISDFGDIISSKLILSQYGEGVRLKDMPIKQRYCEAVTGGMNISKRSFYERVGLQDENLFMYSDEADMGLRAKPLGIKMAVTLEAKSWHQHIKSPVVIKHHPYSSYLIARNKVYLAYKHFDSQKVREIFNYYFWNGLSHYVTCLIRFRFDRAQSFRWQMLGAWYGLRKNMKPNKYSSL